MTPKQTFTALADFMQQHDITFFLQHNREAPSDLWVAVGEDHSIVFETTGNHADEYDHTDIRSLSKDQP